MKENIEEYEKYTNALLRNETYLDNVPNEFIDEDLCKIAVTSWGTNLKYVPEKYLTYNICKSAIMTHGGALEFVPEQFKTKELCEIAASNSRHVIKYIPEKFLTEEILQHIIVKYNHFKISDIQMIPKHLLTENLCKLAIICNGANLEYVPVELRTEKLCKLAIETCFEAAKFAPIGSAIHNNYIMEKALL